MAALTVVAHASAQPAGKQAEQVSKRLAESRRFVIDLAPLLAQHELAVKAGNASSSVPGVQLLDVRTRHGRYLELQVSGGQVPSGARHADQLLSTMVETSTGQQLAAVVSLRVFAE